MRPKRASGIIRKQTYLDPFDSDFQKHIETLKDAKICNEQRIELTCSFIPGTTLRMNKVKIPAIGFKVYDTPGVLSTAQPYALIDDFKALKAFAFTKEVKPVGVRLSPKHSLLVGGVARIDLLSVVSKVRTTRNGLFSA